MVETVPAVGGGPRRRKRLDLDGDVASETVLVVDLAQTAEDAWLIDVPADSVESILRRKPAADAGVALFELVAVLELDGDPLAASEQQAVGSMAVVAVG